MVLLGIDHRCLNPVTWYLPCDLPVITTQVPKRSGLGKQTAHEGATNVASKARKIQGT